MRSKCILRMQLSTLAIGLILTACGGGGGGGLFVEGGVGGTGITFGKVTQFGSVFVNGVEYDTSMATILVEGQPAPQSESDLAVGMVVKINGTANADGVTGSADVIEYSDALEGRVDANDIVTNNTLTVMAQTVRVDADTVYAKGNCTNTVTIEQILVGANVEVSGFTDGNGLIYASRVECKTDVWSGGPIEVKGIVSSVDSTANTLAIGALTVDWSGASLPDGSPQDGWYVEIQGDSFNGSVFEADRIEQENDGDTQIGEDGDELELQGVVTFSLVNNRFGLNGQTVEVSGATQYEGGGLSDIQLGRNLKAKGSITNGVTVADEIKFAAEESEKQELKGLVAGIDTSTNSLALLGQTVRVDNGTTWEDERDGSQSFSLGNLAIGDFVDTNVNPSGSGWLASKVKRKSDPGYAEVEGIVQQVAGNQITVVGVTIDISPAGCGISPQVNDRVEVRGTYSGGVLTANIKCEIE